MQGTHLQTVRILTIYSLKGPSLGSKHESDKNNRLRRERVVGRIVMGRQCQPIRQHPNGVEGAAYSKSL